MEEIKNKVICHGDAKEGLSAGQVCPLCGKPLLLIGDRTLTMPTNVKAYCEYCPYEETEE